MTQDQLDFVVSKTGHDRLRSLTSDDNADAIEREGYRSIVETMFAHFQSPLIPSQESEFPSLLEQFGNAAKAAVDFVASGFETVDDAEYERRRKICRACDQFDAKADRCKRCGCSMAIKARGKVFACPEGKW